MFLTNLKRTTLTALFGLAAVVGGNAPSPPAAASPSHGLPAAVSDQPKGDAGQVANPLETAFPSFHGRFQPLRKKLLEAGGGSKESEAAVALGLSWLAHHQEADGRWKLDGRFPDKGNENDAAATALGLLPFLSAGKSHKPLKDNTYNLALDKALGYLVGIQDKTNGSFSKDMYAHGLSTIALCEAYGMTKDDQLKKPAQAALNYIVAAQHGQGGWRYNPGQAGDTSLTGWQVTALKTGVMSGLDVPAKSLRKAQDFLYNEVLHAQTEGYGYTDGDRPTKTMTAVGLLCRQKLQGWGSGNLKLIKGVDNYIKPNRPKADVKDVYYYYYATQVMHQFGGEEWKNWNGKYRDLLIKSQEADRGKPEVWGSWSPAGDVWGQSGGRLMVTSFNLLSLEAYYRYAPVAVEVLRFPVEIK